MNGKSIRTLAVWLLVMSILTAGVVPVALAQESKDLPEGAPFTIGVSNGFVGSEWRTQMIKNMEEANAVYMAESLTNELVVESADVDVQGQIQQIQNLINRGVDAIIINPNDQNALNPIIEEAVAAGILVIAVDQEVSSPDALNVVTDQKEWAKISARWLAEQLNGEGDIVLIEGFVGHPANEARMAGVAEVLADNPGLNVVGRDTGMWDQATGQQVMSDFLASLPNIDGVWTQDGMAEGALRAVMTANPEEWPVMVGEARAGYIQLWDSVKQDRPGFTSFGVVNPPGQGVDGLRVAVALLSGSEIADGVLRGEFGNTLYVPIPGTVSEANYAEVYEMYKDSPVSYTLDGMIADDEAAMLMSGEVTAEDLMAEAGMGAMEEPMALPEGAPFTIGVSNGFVGSEWRTQMIKNMEEANAVYMAESLTNELVVESADVDVQGQIQQIQNLINRGVDAIIINPNDQNALNPIIEEAVAAGILVIAVDQEVSSPDALNVVTDQKEWAKISARWLAEQLNGEGDIVLIEGFVGHPANEARMAGVAEVLADNPGLNVVGRDTGMWDQATGQQVMSDFLASLPNIDGVWTQDGMAEGALRAVMTANPEEWPVMVGEARAGYIQLWDSVKQDRPGFTSFGVVNPPGQGVDGLRVAVALLSGSEIADGVLRGEFGNTLYVPIPGTVSEDNYAEVYEMYKDSPVSYTLDGMITDDEATMLMSGEVTAEDLMAMQ